MTTSRVAVTTPRATVIEVEINPVSQKAGAGTMSPEEISTTLAAMNRIAPFELTEAEQAEWDRDRQTSRGAERAKFAEEAERLRRMWE
jgi:PIN domain nuclease of toxin-antitoxin system